MVSKFYLIIDDVSWLKRLLPIGLKLVQLRLKQKSNREIVRQIDYARKLCLSHDCQLVVNDYWQEAMAIGCDFIHLGQEDLLAADIAAIRQAGLGFGISTHSHEELRTALKLSPSYVALGPIYHTTLKQMKWCPQGLERLTEWKKLIGDTPLVAIGGITIERAAKVFDAGADCISVVSDVLFSANPENRLTQWLTICG